MECNYESCDLCRKITTYSKLKENNMEFEIKGVGKIKARFNLCDKCVPMLKNSLENIREFNKEGE